MCQCSLFKQFTTFIGIVRKDLGLFIVCVNVLFLSNSQRVAHDSEYWECSEQSEVCWDGRLCPLVRFVVYLLHSFLFYKGDGGYCPPPPW